MSIRGLIDSLRRLSLCAVIIAVSLSSLAGCEALDEEQTIDDALLWPIEEPDNINARRQYYIIAGDVANGMPLDTLREQGIPVADSCEFILVDDAEGESRSLSVLETREYIASNFGLGSVVVTTRFGKAVRVELAPLEQ